MLLKKIKTIVSNPSTIIIGLASRGFLNWLPDKQYLKLYYFGHMHKKLNLKNPKTFNEKLQWLKLYDRKPEYTMMVDKYEVKKYIAEQIGEEYVIPTLGVWDSPEDIDFDSLPEKFALKCNHNSGLGMYICKDKTKMNVEKVKKELWRGIKQNYYWSGREWPYKNVKPRIIAEQYMEDSETAELRDYKIFCFNGVAKAMFVATERQKSGEEVKFDFFDMDFKHLCLKQGHPNADVCPVKPKLLDEMKRLAEKLSYNIPHVRVDFYEVNGRVYFGEFTFYHFSGVVPFNPEEWDYKFGEWIELPTKKG